MRFFLIPLAILLGFLILEIFTLVRLADIVGWWLLGWLLFAASAGWYVLRKARFVLLFRLLSALRSGREPSDSMYYAFAPFVAGVLLILPGVISDFIALLMLCGASIPSRRKSARQEDGVIQGEWDKVDDRLK